LINLVLKLFPYGRRSDRVANYLRFVCRHRRRPTRHLRLNDVLFRIKTSGELADPLRVFTTDKENVKRFLADVIGPDHVVPTLAVLQSPEEVAAFRFPDNCIAKPTHSSGQLQRIENGGAVDRAEMLGWFAHDHYRKRREENYRTLRKKVIVEPLLFCPATLREFKFYSYLGRVNALIFKRQEASGPEFYFFDRDWSGLPYRTPLAGAVGEIEKPACLTEMLAAAEAIGRHFGFVRVDFLTDGRRFYVGEITHCEGGAQYRFGSRRHPDLISEEVASRVIFGPEPAEKPAMAAGATGCSMYAPAGGSGGQANGRRG
jgi:hypothetical protein